MEEGTALTRPSPETDDAIASMLGETWLARTTLETDWSWRVAAFAARRGLRDEDIEAALRGPIAMPDVSTQVAAARRMAQDERATASGSGETLADGTGMRDQERSREEATGVDNEAVREGEGGQAAVTSTVAAPGQELPSAQVLLLSKGDGNTENVEGTAGGVVQEPAE